MLCDPFEGEAGEIEPPEVVVVLGICIEVLVL